MNLNNIMIMKKNFFKQGFTLIEVLIAIGLVAILAGIVVIAVNPARQFALGRDTQRRSDVNAILNAIYQYATDNNGTLPASITALAVDTPTEICKSPPSTCTGLVDLHTTLVGSNQTYLISIPNDPSGSDANSTEYTISRNTNNRITVAAPFDETSTISVTR